MDLNPALQTLISTAKLAGQNGAVAVLRPESFLPGDMVAEYLPGKEVRLLTIKRPRRYTSTTIDGFCEALNYLKGQVCKTGDSATCDAPAGPVFVTVGETGIEAILGEHERRDLLRMPLTLSDAYTQLDEQEEMDQEDFVAALRELFNGNVSPSDLIAQLRKIKFKRSNEGEGNVDPSRQSFRAESLMEISGMGKEFPEDVSVNVGCFDELWFGELPVSKVNCSLRVNIPKAKFRLVPKAGELETAKAIQLNAAAKYIGEKCADVHVATCTMNGDSAS